MTSRERMLVALNNQQPDHVPCSFMIFDALRASCGDAIALLERELNMGLDARVSLPKLPLSFDSRVAVREWQEQPSTEGPALLHKEYRTPVGTLRAVIKQTPDWPYGDHVPLFDDYLVPRSAKFLIEDEGDLEPLRFLLAEPTSEDICEFRQKAKALKKIAAERELLLTGGWHGTDGLDWGIMGMDAVMWLCGMQQALLLAVDEPEMLERLVQMIAAWNQRRMQIILEQDVDLIIKRGWYESTELWSPQLYSKFILPVLTADVKMAHEAGAKFGYIMTSGVMPLLDHIIDAGVDVLIGVDPLEGKGTDLAQIKQRAAGKLALWGGVNGCLTIEMGTVEESEEAVEQAIAALAPGGGFILSPVDNVTDTSPRTWRNVDALLVAWEEHREYR